MKRNIETRVYSLSDLQFRDDNGPPHFSGYAALFNKETELWPGFREVVAPGAFTKTLQERDDVVLLFNHDPDSVLSSTKSGSLELAQDGAGLRVASTLDPTDTDTQRVVPKMKRGDLTQMSFGFETIKHQIDDLPDGSRLRTLLEVKLWDVSVVTWPAYTDTTADVRALAMRSIDSDIADVADIDVEAWNSALAELREGKVLSESNLKLVRDALEALTALVDAAAPKADETKSITRDGMRRRMAMLEANLAA